MCVCVCLYVVYSLLSLSFTKCVVNEPQLCIYIFGEMWYRTHTKKCETSSRSGLLCVRIEHYWLRSVRECLYRCQYLSMYWCVWGQTRTFPVSTERIPHTNLRFTKTVLKSSQLSHISSHNAKRGNAFYAPLCVWYFPQKVTAGVVWWKIVNASHGQHTSSVRLNNSAVHSHTHFRSSASQTCGSVVSDGYIEATSRGMCLFFIVIASHLILSSSFVYSTVVPVWSSAKGCVFFRRVCDWSEWMSGKLNV